MNTIIKQRIIPFYSASVTNIASQMTANRCNYMPAWIDAYGTILDGSSVYSDLVKGLVTEFDQFLIRVTLNDKP